MTDPNDEDLLSGIDILVSQAKQLIEKFGNEITFADAPTYGSERYRKTAHELNRLNRVEVQLQDAGRTVDWERTTIDGRDGSEIFRRLDLVKRLLQTMGEGAAQPKAAASN